MAIKRIFNKRYIIGIDPGTGSTSPCGFALYDSKEDKILATYGVWPTSGKAPKDMAVRERIFRISEKIKDLVESVVDSYGVDQVGLSIEAFLIRGKGGETLMRLKGAILAKVPLTLEVIEIQNSTMKKRAGGHGGADKKEIADHLSFTLDASNRDILTALTNLGKWDEIDAVGLAVSAKGAEYERI